MDPPAMVLPPQTRLAWHNEQGSFRLIPTQAVTAPSLTVKIAAARGLEEHVKSFTVEKMKTSSLSEVEDVRRGLHHRLLSADAESIVEWLPAFLEQWDAILGDHEMKAGLHCAEELRELANTYLLMGEVAKTRQALSRCIAVIRNVKLDVGDSPTQAMLLVAKRTLMKCIGIQENLESCSRMLTRQHPPPQILRQILVDVEALSKVSPYSRELVSIRAHVLLRMRRTGEILTLLRFSPFLPVDAGLQLLYVNALGIEGFYQNALDCAQTFLRETNIRDHTKPFHEPELNPTYEELNRYQDTLRSVVELKTRADLTKSQDAERLYLKCLDAIPPLHKKLRAAVLVGYANALSEQKRLQCAHKALQEVVALEPAHTVAQMGLRTIELELETQTLQNQLAL